MDSTTQVAGQVAEATRQDDYEALISDLAQRIPAERLIRDPLRMLAYGTDASFYRLVPKLVVRVESVDEVRRLLVACRRYGAPVTFRAAGTSLSGQAVSDSVLCVLGDGWSWAEVSADAATIRLGPGMLGSDANARLIGHGRKIGPDPASINACKIGGIAANNASGMCCGTAQNSYNTLASMQIMLADSSMLDTGDATSRAAFQQSHGALLDRLAELGRQVRANETLAARIRRKFAIKNTTGYSLNALVDFDDPIDILQHLMIGSEGTLGFIAEVTYRTVPEYANKATALLMFPSIDEACRAVIRLKPTPVSAVELIDRASLRSVEDKPGMPEFIRGLPDGATALLVDVRAENQTTLAAHLATVTDALHGLTTLYPAEFSQKAVDYERYWNIRKGLFPSIGGMRPTGTTVIIEDIAFPIERLADATADLQRLFVEFGYSEAILFGHALEGNLHFVITPELGRAEELDRYRRFMDAVAHLVVDVYDGSLKAEHGTGRNMAPFVELEWGAQAYALMREVKALLDPENLLNPGVILNDDPEVHIKNLKPLPAADPLVDKCMECGFCERMCPSQGLTFTPRQRIIGWRELSRLRAIGDEAGVAALSPSYDYQGLDTCAACGLCATACPVSIEVGSLTKKLRGDRQGPTAHRVGGLLAGGYGPVLAATRVGLRVAGFATRIFGAETLAGIAETARQLSHGRTPIWSRFMPTAVSFKPRTDQPVGDRPAVVYLPSCVARTMGPAPDDPQQEPLPTKTEALLHKAGFRVIYPEGMNNLCCGQPFESKGLFAEADAKTREVERALAKASEDGRLPIVSDTSPCSLRLKQKLPERLRPLDIVEFIHDRMMERLLFRKQPGAVAVHVPCSGRKMALDTKMKAIAAACAETVVMPDGIGCCGWAGDKGFTTPELNAHALRTLKDSLPEGCTNGYSSSRTCEIGLAIHSDRPYRSIVYLVDASTTGRRNPPPTGA